MKVEKMSLNNIRYQGVNNYGCPDCDFDFLKEQTNYIIGYGKERNNNSNKNYGIIFECPKCFIISYCHATETYIKSLKRLKEQMDSQYNK